MTAVTESEFFDVAGGLRFRREGYTTPVDIPASGVLTVSTTGGASITIGGGGATTLRGINYVDESGNAIALDRDAADVKVFRAAPGVVITVAHNATEDLEANALADEQRIVTSSGNDFTLAQTNAQAFYSWVQIAGGFRWYFADERSFAPAAPEDWATSPTSTAEAIDRLASALADLTGVPIP